MQAASRPTSAARRPLTEASRREGPSMTRASVPAPGPAIAHLRASECSLSWSGSEFVEGMPTSASAPFLRTLPHPNELPTFVPICSFVDIGKEGLRRRRPDTKSAK